MRSERKAGVTHRAALHEYRELHALWVKASPGRRQTTVDDYWLVLKSFADATGGKALADLGRKDVIAFRDRLLERSLSATTAAHRIGILKTLFNVGIEYELLSVNPAAQVKTARSRGKARLPFGADDLARIFHSPLYTGGPLPQAGGREAAYWLPLLALFTGARVEELAQLLVKDVRHVPELGHYLNISDEAEHAKLKNAASRRRVPVHRALVACGFIDYVQQVKRSHFLFPHLKPDPRGKLGGYFSNFFSRYLRRCVRIASKRKVFHSFRHTFKEVCRKVGIEEAVHDALTGHAGNAISRRYGNELYPLEPLFAAMERYDIAGLDLSHLYMRPVAHPAASDIRLIAAFYGVLAAFTAARVGAGMAPFVVALYEGAEAGVDVATNRLLYGRLPAGKLLLVNAWIELRREELLASWHAGRLTGEYMKVEPLR